MLRTWHFVQRGELKSPGSGRTSARLEGREVVQGDGTWSLEGDSGFEQENPERHLQLAGAGSSPLVVG